MRGGAMEKALSPYWRTCRLRTRDMSTLPSTPLMATTLAGLRHTFVSGHLNADICATIQSMGISVWLSHLGTVIVELTRGSEEPPFFVKMCDNYMFAVTYPYFRRSTVVSSGTTLRRPSLHYLQQCLSAWHVLGKFV